MWVGGYEGEITPKDISRFECNIKKKKLLQFFNLESVKSILLDYIQRWTYLAVNINILCFFEQEDFLDISLAVADNSSLENSLSNSFVNMELMMNKNRYSCEQCQKLVNAKKVSTIYLE